jgi:hypothetical protein
MLLLLVLLQKTFCVVGLASLSAPIHVEHVLAFYDSSDLLYKKTNTTLFQPRAGSLALPLAAWTTALFHTHSMTTSHDFIASFTPHGRALFSN